MSRRLQPSAFSLQPQAGFTLPELLVVGVIMAVVLGAMLVTFMSGQTSYLAMDASIQIQEEARRAFDTMVREIRGGGSAAPRTVSGKPALDFRVALDYNLLGVAGCPADAVCWGAYDGSGVAHKDYWVEYRVETLGNGRAQLVREVLIGDSGSSPVGPLTPPVTRVLSTLVDDTVTNAFDVSADVVTITLPFKSPRNALVPGSTSGQATTLASKVKLRNPSP
ncbi:MAG: prepilin-type N-terminal cleavage/methylation domain-containing protein [Candidatus Omnitrophica bacterium]|nr:prepilin-type N-terminal cleavage/methylation domain-containing protein [Candidatus Omnitrophota bacterium]